MTDSSSGNPVAYGSIGVYSTTDSNTSFLLTANANGTYSLPNLPAGTYDIVAFGPNNLVSIDQAVTISGAGGSFNFSLTPSGATVITGAIVDNNNLPVTGATVTAVNSSNQIVGVGVTNASGIYTINSATGQNLTLYVSKPQGLVIEVGEFSEDPGQNTTVPTTAYVSFGDGINQAIAAAISNVSGLFQSVNSTIQTILNPLSVIQPVIDEVHNFTVVYLSNPPPPGPGACPATTAGYNSAAAAILAEHMAATDAVLAQGTALISAQAFPGVYEREIATNVCTALQAAAAILGASPAALTAMAELGQSVTAASIAAQLVGLAGNIQTLGSDVISLSKSLQTAKLGDDINAVFAGNFTAITAAFTDVIGIVTGLRGIIGDALSKLGPAEHVVPGISPALAAGPLQALLGVVIGFLNGGLDHIQFTDTQDAIADLVPKLNDFIAKRAAYYQALAAANAAIASANNTGASHSGSAGGCGTGSGGGDAGTGGGSISGGSISLSGHDPNDIEGPAGYGSQSFIQAAQPLGYTINFENSPTASASTAVVTVTETLDPNVDISTFKLGNFGFGGITVTVPAGLTSYQTIVNDTAATGLDVAVQASLDVQTRVVTWTFTSIDPTTGQPPSNPLLGFLPPDVTAPQGLGFVSYTVDPVAGLVTGSAVSAQASVVFDANPPISTALFTNTIDAVAPTSTLTALPVHEAPSFTLQWSGSDDPGGSGLAFYNIYYSVNGGPYQALLLNTTRTAAFFNGIVGDTYSFYSVAVDNAGNTELAPATPEATTQVVQPSLATVTAKKAYSFTDASGNLVTVKLSGPGSAVAMLEGGVSNDADLRTLTLTNTTTASALSVTVKKVGHSDGTTSIDEIFTAGSNESAGSITLGAGVSLGSGLDDGSMTLDLSGGVKSLTLDGGLNVDAHVDATGAIGTVTVSDLNQSGDAAAVDDAGFSAASFGNISAALTGTAAMTSGTAILDSSFIATAGNMGNITAKVTSSAAAADLTAITGSSFSATGSIGLITASATGTAKTPTGGSATAIGDADGVVDFTAGASIGGNMTGESLVAGINVAGDTYNDNAGISSVTVAGAFSDSSIIAGINPGSDGYWGGTTDIAGTKAAGVTDTSKIGAIKLGASTLSPGVTSPFGSPATGIEQSAIESLALTSVQIGKLKALTSFGPSHWINYSGGIETSSDTAIAVIPA